MRLPPPVAVDALDAGAEVEVLGDAHLGVEGAAFRHVADAAPHLDRVPEDIEAVDGRLAGRGGDVARQDAHGRALAGAVGAEKADDLALEHVERYVLHGRVVVVVLGEVAHMNHGSLPEGGVPPADGRRWEKPLLGSLIRSASDTPNVRIEEGRRHPKI